MSWLVPALVAAVVSIATMLYTHLTLSQKDMLEHHRKISEVQGQIVKGLGEKRGVSDYAEVANLLLSEELEPLYENYRPYRWSKADKSGFDRFVIRIDALRRTAADQGRTAPGASDAAPSATSAKSFNIPSAEQPPPDRSSPMGQVPTTSEIQNTLNGPGRLRFSDNLVRRATGSEEAYAKALIQSLLPEKDPASYRVNLYVTFTLARFPNGWPSSADPNGAVVALMRTTNFADPTFAKRVREALENKV